MKTKFLIIFALIMIPVMTESFAEEVELKFGETVSYENLKLSFYDVEDSRCPSDVTCVWEGKVSARIHINNQTHKIPSPIELNIPLTHTPPYTITLIDVKPYPTSTEKTKESNYIATLEIAKPKPMPTDFRETNEENLSIITLIQSLGATLIVFFIIIYAIKKIMIKKSIEKKKQR